MIFLRRLLRFRKTLVVLVLLVAFGNVACHTPKFAVPDGVVRTTVRLTVSGESFAASVYAPQMADAPPPVVIVAHGFTRSRRYMQGWGAVLAENGMIAVVINQPAFANPALNGRVIAGLADDLRDHAVERIGRETNGAVALVGFSMGGLATLLAAADAPEVRAWVGLDPVDFEDRGADRIASLKMPQCILRAEPAAWNRGGNARKLAARSGGPLFALKVREATHCDVEEPCDLAGKLACGWTDSERHEVFERYAVAFLRSVLWDDPDARQVLQAADGDARVSEVVRR